MATPVDTITLNEDDDRSSRHQTLIQINQAVDIAQAEAAFNDLSRQLSKSSRLASSHLDIEKGADVNEPFDLREYL